MLEPLASYHAREYGFFKRQFTVLQTAVQQLFDHADTAFHLQAKLLLDLIACFGTDHIGKPILLRGLLSRGNDRNGVAIFELMFERHILSIDISSDGLTADARMDGKSKVQHTGSLRQLDQFSRGSESIDLIGEEVHLEVFHRLRRIVRGVIACLKRLAYGSEELIQSALALDTFVLPVSSQSSFVHATGANLHLHPPILRSHHRNVERLITVAFGDGDPVLHSLWIGLIHVRDDGIDMPAGSFLIFHGHIQYDSYGKKIVYGFELDTLLTKLVANAVDALGTPLHLVRDIGQSFVQPTAQRSDESFDIGIAATLRLSEFSFDEVESLPVCIFQTEVFHFALDGIESEPVCQRSIEIRHLCSQGRTLFGTDHVFGLAQQIGTVSDDEQHHANIFGDGEEEVLEVGRIDSRIAHVDLRCFQQEVDQASHIFAHELGYLLRSHQSLHRRTIEEECSDGLYPQLDLTGGYACHFHVAQKSVHTVFVAIETSQLRKTAQQTAYFLHELPIGSQCTNQTRV